MNEKKSWLRYYRKMRGMTQYTLAQKSGVNIRQIQRIEAGESDIHNISGVNLVSLSESLNIEPKMLLDGPKNEYEAIDPSRSLWENWLYNSAPLSVTLHAVPGGPEKVKSISERLETQESDLLGFELMFNGGERYKDDDEIIVNLHELDNLAIKIIKEHILANLSQTTIRGLAALTNNTKLHGIAYYETIRFCYALGDWGIDDLLEDWVEKNPGYIERRYDSDGIGSWCLCEGAPK